MKKIILFGAVAALLSACGGGGGSFGIPPPTAGTGGSGDTFISAILALIGTATDDQQAISIDGVTQTTPEDASPTVM